MGRNNPKPTDKIDWTATGESITPSAARKLAGWLFGVKPPAQNFNWKWVLDTLNITHLFAQVEDWIVIDSDADEGDYATLTAYLADAPAAGNRVLIKEDQTVTVQTVIPSDITLKFLDGSRLLCATNIATSVLQFSSNIPIEGVLNVVLSQTGVTAKAVEFNGDNVTGKINVENASTGTLTTGYHINASKTGNKVEGFIDNTGGGVLTNVYADNSTEDSNLLIIVDNPNSTIKTNGTTFVDLLTAQIIAGVKTFSNAIIASGGIQTDGVNTLKTKVIDIGDWDMDATDIVSVTLGVSRQSVRSIDCIVRDDDSTTNIFKLNRPVDWTNTAPQGGITGGAGAGTDIGLVRLSGGYFDNVSFNATSYNRGWVIITYIA